MGGEEGQSPRSRRETGLAFPTAALSMCILVWIILGATKAVEDDLDPLSFQQLIRAYPSLVPPPALAVTTFIRNLTLFFGWISPENPIYGSPVIANV